MPKSTGNDYKKRIIELEESANFYKNIVDNAHECEVYRDVHGKVIYVNAAFERITGFDSKAFLNGTITEKDIVYPDDWELVATLFNLFEQEQKVTNFKFRILTFDKAVRFLNLNAAPIFRNGVFVGTSMSFYDISGQKDFTKLDEMHRASILSDHKFKTYIQSSPTPVFLSNSKGQYTYANLTACELLGYSEAQLKHMSISDILPEQCLAAGLNYFNEINTKEKVQNFTTLLKRIDGKYLDVVLDGCKLNDNEFITYVKDISYLKIAENLLREQNAEYETLNEELRQANDELYELRQKSEDSRLQYERLFENLEQGFALHEMIYDDNGLPVDYRFLLMNPAFERLTGLKSEDAIGKTVLQLLPATEKAWIEQYGRVAMTAKSLQFESYSKEMDAFYDVVAYAPKKDQFAVIFSDVSEIKSSHKLLSSAKKHAEESEAQFKALHDASFGGIFLHEKGVIFNCNHGLSEITGYSRNELIGMNFLLLLTEESRSLLSHKVETSSEDSYEVVGLRKNGTTFSMKLDARNIPYKGRIAQSVEVRDVSDYNKALSALTQSERYLQLFMNSGPDFFFLKNNELRYVISNDANSAFLRKKTSEIIGKTDFELMPSNIATACCKSDKLAIQQRKIIKGIENVDGVFYETWKIPVFENGEVVGVAGIIRDVTKQHKAEKQLITAKEYAEQSELSLSLKNQEYEALNEELRHMNEELYIAKERAEESNRLKTAFLNNISHEFRTPMNGILGFTELFVRPGKTLAHKEKYITIIRENCDRLLDLVTDTVEISTIQSKAVKINTQKFNIQDLIHDVSSVIAPLAQKKGVEYILTLPSEIDEVIVFSDRYKLYRSLKHVLTNSVKFTNVGSVTLKCDIVAGMLQILIIDTGYGILPEVLANLFEPYKQAETNEHYNYGGTGIGLSLVKSYIELLNGTIEIESELLVGTKVRLLLPLQLTILN